MVKWSTNYILQIISDQMAFQPSIKLSVAPSSSAVPSLCTTVLLLIVVSISSLSCSHAKSRCRCTGSDHDQDLSSGNYYYNMSVSDIPFNDTYGELYLTNSSGIQQQYVPSYYYSAILEDYKKGHHPELNLSDFGLFLMDESGWFSSQKYFSFVFNMSLNPHDPGGLIFAIIPDVYYNFSSVIPTINGSFDSRANGLAQFAGNSSIHVRAGVLPWPSSVNHSIICVQITAKNSTEAGDSAALSSDYIVSIAYNDLQSKMSIQVQVATDGQPSDSGGIVAVLESVTINMNIDISQTIVSDSGTFGFCSSMGQLLQLHTWSWTAEVLPAPESSQGSTTIIVSSVLGSAAATAVMAALVYWYFNSKYRGWKKDLDQLAKSILLMPGVPTQFDFTEIRRATNNFHETMRLGQGGFGTVYRCRLRPPKRAEAAMEVAVKKFSRDDNRRYDDFLAEVSVINRLRHKNIVPLVGWSYHKGEPLLIYEFMPNGSLDQHLFRRSSSSMQKQQQQQLATPIHQWTTRYNMVKDIATGLHYVHHEYEPMVLHRDIKASNVMIDSTFQARLGDFGLACVVANGKNSYTDLGAPGTIGFMAPEYIYSGKATAKSDVFAFGVLVLEIVTGQRAVKNPQFSHITDWVWQHHKEDKLLNVVDPILRTDEEFEAGDAKRMLLLGLACSNPRPSERPTMVEAVQIIVARSARPPDVPLEIPRFLWPPTEEEGCSLSSDDYITELSNLNRGPSMQVEMAAGGQTSSSSGNGGNNSLHQSPIRGPSQEVSSIYHTAPASHRRVFTHEFSS